MKRIGKRFALVVMLNCLVLSGCGQEVVYKEVELATEDLLLAEDGQNGKDSNVAGGKTSADNLDGEKEQESFDEQNMDKASAETATEETTTEETTTELVTVAPDGTIAGTPSWASIEADVSLSGSGTGFHAKLVMCTPTSAVSYGIQYDSCAAAPYTGKTMALVENIGSNNPGGQSYFRPSNVELQLEQSYHMMLTLNRDGSGSVYLDGNKIGDYYNPNLGYQDIVYLRVEGSGRKNGDSVYANFNNIKLKVNGSYQPGKEWGIHEFQQNPGIGANASTTNVYIAGTVVGIADHEDWDSRYNDVSGIIQFIQ